MDYREKTIMELPEEERPYEKCLQNGPAALSDAELLAVILRTGTKGKSSVALAQEILSQTGAYTGLVGIIHRSVEELRAIPGIGTVKAVQLRCVAELARRIARTPAERRLKFNDPESIADYYMESLRHEEQEIVLCMMFDTKNNLLGDEIITRGTVNLSLISPREVFLAALAWHAVQIVLVHNHPSGDAMPSPEDLLVTERVRAAGEMLGIHLLDHIIIGDMCFESICGDRTVWEISPAQLQLPDSDSAFFQTAGL
ncbi:MAG: DNA repair protein RadC [Eubacterium sp.]|nr:DNA repair protein RadC [Eubacterium sp.]